MPDVGIVMPVYKQKETFLRKAIQSVLKQSYTNFKFVVVIDGAPEMYGLIEREVRHDPRVTIISNAKNQGVAKALNCGFDYLFQDAGIEYLTWVSSDNVYYPDYLRVQRKLLKRGPERLGLVYTCFRPINDDDAPVYGATHKEDMIAYQAKPKEELLDFCLIGPSFMYKSRYAKAVGGYGMEPVEDYDFWLRLTEVCEIQYLPQVLMDYRTNSQYSVSAQLKSKDQHRRYRYAFQTAKFQARRRRGIPVETTILHTIKDGSEPSIDFLENILEQYYSNFQLLVLDLSPGGLAAKPLSAILDPRIHYMAMPGMSEREAVIRALRNVKSSYSLVYGGRTMRMFDVHRLSMEWNKTQAAFISAYIVPENATIGFRSEPAPHVPVYNELYRTTALKSLLKLHH